MQNINPKIAEMEAQAWDQDVNSYHRNLRMLNLSTLVNHYVSSFSRLQGIRDRWPTHKKVFDSMDKTNFPPICVCCSEIHGPSDSFPDFPYGHQPMVLSYVCPNEECNSEWEDTWCSAVDSDECPNCGLRHITPSNT